MEKTIIRPKSKNSGFVAHPRSSAGKALSRAKNTKAQFNVTGDATQTAIDRIFVTAKPNQWETVGTLSRGSGLSVATVEDVVRADSGKFETATLAGTTVVRAKK